MCKWVVVDWIRNPAEEGCEWPVHSFFETRVAARKEKKRVVRRWGFDRVVKIFKLVEVR